MDELIAMIRRAGVARLAGVFGVGAGVAVALVLTVARIAEPSMGVLYGGLELAEAQSVVDRLEQDGIAHETREADGRVAILAPQADIPKLRLQFAGAGVAPRGGVGYEIFDGEDAFGSTSFQQNIKRLRALEGELARTIASIEGVRSARVHLVLPERELFSRDKEPASASIVIDSDGLDPKSVRAIVNFAASATPGLSPTRVTVVDAEGALLHSGQAEDQIAGGADERSQATETRLRRTVEEILGRIVGPENLRIEVAAEMDFNRVTENAEIIDPDSQTVLSSTTVEEAADESQPVQGRGVSVANALPGAQTVVQDAPPATSANRRTEETTNYEMSRTTRTEVREQGLIKRLSVAVALNAGATPRSNEELQRIEALAKSAVGFNEARGDRVDVVEIAFQPVAAAAPQGVEATQGGATRTQIMRMAEIAALVLIALALVIFVIRPLVAPKLRARTASAEARADEGVAATISDQAALPAPARELERRIDLAQVEGRVRATSIGKVAEAVKSHTDESTKILKGWIRQAS